MTLSAGARLGPYEIVALLGKGGMGEVYRARDTRLERDVAIKVLAAALSRDPRVRERFEREARIVCRFQHPNVCTLYDVVSADGGECLVMEYLEGATLEERLRKGPLALAEVLAIGGQVAEAIEAAHRKGIVHRDLKPGNVMLTRTGAKVLDFGIARELPRSAALLDTGSQTLPAAMTEEGALVGTMPYMSPEQLQGEPVDGRTDIWALGCILYEMATGARPFQGSKAQLVSSIMAAEPAMTGIGAPLPKRLERIVSRCFDRDPERRWQSARDVSLELEAAADEPPPEAVGVSAKTAPMLARRWVAAAALSSVLGLAVGLLLARQGASTSAPPLTRLSFSLPENTRVNLHDAHVSRIAISPDGQRVVVATGSGPLLVRSLAGLELRRLEGTEGATQPFFSPDGAWVGFFTLDGRLRKVPVEGGGSIDVATGLVGARWSSGAWREGGDIVFAPDAGGVFRVSSDGGEIEEVPLTKERAFSTPAAVPGTDLVLLTERSVSPQRIVWLDLETGDVGVVVERAWDPRVTASRRLLFARDRGVLAASLAEDARSLVSAPVQVPEPIAFDHPMVVSSQPQFAVSAGGTLAYVRPLGDQQLAEELVWVDRATHEQQPVGSLPPEGCLSLSSDGAWLLTTALERGRLAIAALDLRRGVATPLLDAAATVTGPAIWIPGTNEFVYPETTPRLGRILRASIDGGRPPELVLEEKLTLAITPWSVSPDGVLAYTVSSNESGMDVRFHSLATGGALPIDFLSGPSDERQPAFSPDGAWIAYESNEIEGQYQVFVRQFPAGTGKQRVSTVPFSISPRWSADGSELFFQQWGGTFFAVGVSGGETLTIGASEALFRIPGRSGTDLGPKYAVSPDARRFLLPLPNLAVVSASEIVVVQNWLDELDRLIGAPR